MFHRFQQWQNISQSECLCEYESVRISCPPPPVALLCHPALGARSNGRGWSTMWELVPVGGVKRPPWWYQNIYHNGIVTHTHQTHKNVRMNSVQHSEITCKRHGVVPRCSDFTPLKGSPSTNRGLKSKEIIKKKIAFLTERAEWQNS